MSYFWLPMRELFRNRYLSTLTYFIVLIINPALAHLLFFRLPVATECGYCFVFRENEGGGDTDNLITRGRRLKCVFFFQRIPQTTIIVLSLNELINRQLISLAPSQAQRKSRHTCNLYWLSPKDLFKDNTYLNTIF